MYSNKLIFSLSYVCGSGYHMYVNIVVFIENKKTPEGVYAGCVSLSYNYVE